MKTGPVLALAAFVIVAAIRISAPSDIHTGDQPFQADYIRDIVENDAWIVQHHADGTAATKPPLYNWLAAICVFLSGTANDFTLKLPSLIAGLLTVLLTWDLAHRVANERTATFACLLMIASTMFSKHMYFARTDMLLTAVIVAQIWAGVRFDGDGRRRWLAVLYAAGALGFLTKGPIAVAIPLLILAAWWFRSGELRTKIRAMHIASGLLVVLLPFAIWFVAALVEEGRAVWDQMVVAETIDRFAPGSSKAKEHRHLFYYVPHLLLRMAPASLFGVLAFWKPRREVLVPAIWVMVTLVFLSLIPSKRADRLFPLLPGLCILAGWTLDQFRGRATTLMAMFCGGAFTVAGALAIRGAFGPPLAWAGAVLIVCGVVTILGAHRADANLVVAGVILSMLTVVGVYQHVLSEPAIRERGSTSSPFSFLRPAS